LLFFVEFIYTLAMALPGTFHGHGKIGVESAFQNSESELLLYLYLGVWNTITLHVSFTDYNHDVSPVCEIYFSVL